MKQCWTESEGFSEGFLRLLCGIMLALCCSSFDGWASLCSCLEEAIDRPPILCLGRSLVAPPLHFLVYAICRSSCAGLDVRSWLLEMG